LSAPPRRDPTVYPAEAPLGPQLADEDGEPKTDLDRRGQLVARLASILYLGSRRLLPEA
jgi:hypothetical protein